MAFVCSGTTHIRKQQSRHQSLVVTSRHPHRQSHWTLRRITRGAGITAYPSLSSDGRAVAFASDRNGNWDVILKDLGTGKESVVAGGTDRQMYSVITRDARRVAYGVVVSDPRIERPIYVADLANGAARLVCKDCNGRPRDWFRDGQHIVIERFGRRNSVAVVDEATGEQRELVAASDRSVMDPRLSPDGNGSHSLQGDVAAPLAFTSHRFPPMVPFQNQPGWKLVERVIIPPGHPTGESSTSFLAPVSDPSQSAHAPSIRIPVFPRATSSSCIGLTALWFRR